MDFSGFSAARPVVEYHYALMAAILHWCIQRDIEVFPFFLRILHNVTADFITRSDDSEVQRWGKCGMFRPNPLPWRWGEFLHGVPKIEWFPERVDRPQFSLMRTDRECLSFHVAEWNASNGAGLQFWRDNGIWPLTIDCRP